MHLLKSRKEEREEEIPLYLLSKSDVLNLVYLAIMAMLYIYLLYLTYRRMFVLQPLVMAHMQHSHSEEETDGRDKHNT